MLKAVIDIRPSVLTKFFNISSRNVFLSGGLKASKITPIFKKRNDLDKENYSPVTVVPYMSKVKCIQFESFMEDNLSKLLKQYLEKKLYPTLFSYLVLRVPCSWFMNLLKNFKRMNHDLSITKLWAHVCQKDKLFYEKLFDEKTATSLCK